MQVLVDTKGSFVGHPYSYNASLLCLSGLHFDGFDWYA